MKSQLTFTPDVLSCCTLYNNCDYYYYLTLLVIYEHLAMFCYSLHPVQPEEDWPPLRAWFHSRFFPDRRASASALLAVSGWVSVQHFVTLDDVKRAL